jgi:hypothetical protein
MIHIQVPLHIRPLFKESFRLKSKYLCHKYFFALKNTLKSLLFI